MKKTKRTIGKVFPNNTVIETIYDPKEEETSFAVSANGEIKKAHRYVYKDTTYLPLCVKNAMVKNKLVSFASKPLPYKSLENLIEEIQSFVSGYIKLSDDFLVIVSYYVVLSWVYDKFDQLPYLRKIGDYGTGKTRFLDVVGSICFRSIKLSGSSSVASIFHVLDTVGGTLVLDEADFNRTDKKSELTKILNNGFSKGYPVYRCRLNNKKEYDPKAYLVYGTKLIASRGLFDDDALESRFISEKENFSKKEVENLPVSLPSCFEDQALLLKNKLLGFRFFFFKTLAGQVIYEQIDEVEGRVSQIFSPLIYLACNEQTKDQFKAIAKKVNEELKNSRGASIESHVLLAISMIETSIDKISIGDISKLVFIEWADYHERKITARWIGHVVSKKLCLETYKQSGRIYLKQGQKELLDKLYAKYSVEPKVIS